MIGRRAKRKLELCDSAALLPGVKECLAEARRLGLKTAIVTRNRDEWVERHCSRVRLRHTWDVVVCANAEPTTDKSALYLKALALLDVRASEALAFEDSPAGVRAAKNAGLRCVAIPNDITREAAFDDADLVLRSLADQPLQNVVATTSSMVGADTPRRMTRRLRHAARAVVLDEAERVLLVCFRFPDRDVWATPGGGLHEGETHELALRRELEEEAGLTDFELGPCLWIRDDEMPSIDGVYDAQLERYYLVRVSHFEVDPQLTAAELAAENVADVRWWTLDELASAKELFAPRRLVQLLRQLLEYGPPTAPIETGV